jgi:hypothetical protein
MACYEAMSNVLDETALLRKTYPKLNITTATSHFLTASYERSPYTRIRVTATFPDGYPSHALIVTVDADQVVPPGLKKKLEKEMNQVAQQNAAFVLDMDKEGTISKLEDEEIETGGQCHQLCPVFYHLITFIDANKFVPCWKELRQCVDLIQQCNKEEGASSNDDNASSEKLSTISMKETQGKIILCLRHSEYFYKCSIVVNDGYPSTSNHVDYGKPVTIDMKSTNLPPKIETLLTIQAKDLVRRMQDGLPSEQALLRSNPIKAPKDYKDPRLQKEPEVRLTQERLKGLKHDTETLSMVRELRAVDSGAKQGKKAYYDKSHDAKERRDARRMVQKITKSEIEHDMQADEKDKEWQLEEASRVAGYQISEFDGSHPQPCLRTLVMFLIQHIHRLPEEKCPMCQKHALPDHPDTLKVLFDNSHSANETHKQKQQRIASRLQRPVRTYCGCWYHYECLTKLMTEPPFGAACPDPDCGRRVYHPDFPSNISELERSWANKQARQREIEDASLFL